MYQKLTEKIAGKPEERILSYLMLRSLKQARYSEENLGHFALAALELHPFHLAHPPLSGPDRAPDFEGSACGKCGAGAIAANAAGRQDPARGGCRSEQPDKELAGGAPFAFARAGPRHTDMPSPWSKRRESLASALGGPISLEELHDIAEESSLAERRADEAERELMEWKKVKFMQDRVGEDFDGLIISVTKYGFFVELTDLFVEGLVPLDSLTDDRYTYHENTREIIGQRNRKIYGLGQKLRVLVDRIDPVEKKIQFAILEEEEKKATRRKRRS